jgi:hypothetical protein
MTIRLMTNYTSYTHPTAIHTAHAHGNYACLYMDYHMLGLVHISYLDVIHVCLFPVATALISTQFDGYIESH